MSTTQNRATLELAKEADLNGGPVAQKAYGKIREVIRAAELHMEVSHDGKDRLRRQEVHMPLRMDVAVHPSAPHGATQKFRAQVSITQETFEFDVPVSPGTPQPEKTTGRKEFRRQT